MNCSLLYIFGITAFLPSSAFLLCIYHLASHFRSHCVERIPALSFFSVPVPVGVLFLLELLLLAIPRDISQREQAHIDRIV